MRIGGIGSLTEFIRSSWPATQRHRFLATFTGLWPAGRALWLQARHRPLARFFLALVASSAFCAVAPSLTDVSNAWEKIKINIKRTRAISPINCQHILIHSRRKNFTN